MAIKLDILLRNITPHEEEAKAEISRRAEKLGRIYSPIMNCRVVAEALHKHRRSGIHYNVNIEINLPHKKITVTHEKHKRSSHEDIHVAIRDAFNSAERMLEDHAQEQRGRVKHHDIPPHGRVLTLFPNEDYGIIETSSGDEIYFHRNSVMENEFEKLKPGMEVRFAIEMGEKGLQASTVHPIGKHHVVG